MISIERLGKKDIDYVSAINCLLKQLSDTETLNVRIFLKTIRQKNVYFFGAKDLNKKRPDNLAGIAIISFGKIFEHQFEEMLAAVHTMVIDQDYRGKYIGDMLMGAMLGRAKLIAFENQKNVSVYLISKPAREAANKLYQKYGFKLVDKAEWDKGTNLYKLVITP
ncbi:MAG: GNAT family N-acetyltransferase [Patescibacteria group bacterium]